MVLKLRQEPPDNWSKAKCGETVQENYDPFFEDQEEAVEFCNGTNDGELCPIRHECLIFALINNEKWGVWGGTTPLTRKAIRKKHPINHGKEPRPEWEFQTEEEATEGLDIKELLREVEKDNLAVEE